MRNLKILFAAFAGLLIILPSIADAHVAISDLWTSAGRGYTVRSQAEVLDIGVFNSSGSATFSADWSASPWNPSGRQGGAQGAISGLPGAVSAYRETMSTVVRQNVVNAVDPNAENQPLTPVPEPASLILLGGGLLGLAGAYRRRKSAAK